MKRTLATILFLILAPSLVLASGSGSDGGIDFSVTADENWGSCDDFEGTVTDGTSPIGGATVEIYRSATAKEAGNPGNKTIKGDEYVYVCTAVTDKHGDFEKTTVDDATGKDVEIDEYDKWAFLVEGGGMKGTFAFSTSGLY